MMHSRQMQGQTDIKYVLKLGEANNDTSHKIITFVLKNSTQKQEIMKDKQTER
jgi:hypothetical protein